MEFSKGSSSEILERLSTAYGVETQKQLAEKLGVSAANVSNWVQRNSVPGSAFVKCALDTGCDLEWLANGGYANANFKQLAPNPRFSEKSGQKLIKSMISTGGRPVLQRVMDAYGFSTQKELSEYLEISTGTISTWIRREYFPGDVVIACALETGANLDWLALGTKTKVFNYKEDNKNISIEKKLLKAGKLYADGFSNLPKEFISEFESNNKLSLIVGGNRSGIVDTSINEISNGFWILEIDGTLDFYNVSKRPGNKIKLNNEGEEFECSLNDVKPIGLVLYLLKKLF
jgi:transcriptional regulator with XRE-family HTH domain